MNDRQQSAAASVASARSEGEPEWTRALALEELEPGSLRTFKAGGQQVVLARTGEGEVFALENRCPHEGYPLAQGDLKGPMLTCCWHNWKFDVRDGSCVLGGEGARSFPVRIRNEAVEVDLSEPDSTQFIPGWKQSFEKGLFRHDNGRTIRDGVRLLKAGYDPRALLGDIARYDALHAEYGSTHVLAVSADCLRMLGRYEGVNAMVAIAPALDLCGESNRRLAERERPAALEGATREALREAVQSEDAERAEGLLRGAFASGLGREELESWMYSVLSDHFLDFGHPLIYLVKAQELMRATGGAQAKEIYSGLLYSIVLGTREDTLPYMAAYAKRFGAIESELEEVYTRARDGVHFDPVAVRDAVLDGSTDEAFEAVWKACQAGVRASEIAKALVGAAAHRLLRFDLEVERDPMLAETWLWATHRFTFASAVRNACLRFDSPDCLRFLFQAVAFIHSGKKMDAPEERRVVGEPESIGWQAVLAAICQRDSERAVSGTRALIRDGDSLRELRAGVEDLCLSDPLVRPIVIAHAIKTACAAFEEFEALSDHPDREWVMAAVVRFLASPVIERRVRSMVGASIRWVDEGLMPRKLTQ